MYVGVENSITVLGKELVSWEPRRHPMTEIRGKTSDNNYAAPWLQGGGGIIIIWLFVTF